MMGTDNSTDADADQDEDDVHPHKAGIDAAIRRDTTSLEELFLD